MKMPFLLTELETADMAQLSEFLKAAAARLQKIPKIFAIFFFLNLT